MSAVVSSMQRGHDGRIEEAFAQAKERGEAAFVTFVTAGFPVKEGEIYYYIMCGSCLFVCDLMRSCFWGMVLLWGMCVCVCVEGVLGAQCDEFGIAW